MNGAPHDEETQGSTSLSSSGPRPLTQADLPPGTVIDKYRLGNVLGQGGMGLVVAAEHIQLRERVALKFLRVEGDTTQGFRSRFRREAQICAQIKNEHITRVLDIGTFKDADYMVMERLEGSDLRGFLKQKAPLEIAHAVDIAVQACEGLAEVHARGVVHRDLKPSNLFVTQRSDGSPLIKILDFGISKWASEMDAEEEELTKTGAVLGSPKYMAPEQLFGSSTVDQRADVWSIGAILYELLTGKPPFEEPTFARLCVRISSGQPPQRPRERRPEISEELDAAVMLCLEPNVANRLPNVASAAGEFLAAIGDALAEPIRERLQAVLDGGTLGTSGATPMMRSGQYVAASMTLTRTGSNPSGRSSVSAANAAAVEVAVAPQSRGRGKVIIALVAVIAAIGLVFFLRRPQEPAAAASPNPEPKPVASSASAPAATETAPATTTDVATSDVATSEPVVPSATTATTHNTKAIVAGKTVKATAPTKTAEPAPTTTAAPTATPASPAPVVTPPKSANPLEDRQ